MFMNRQNGLEIIDNKFMISEPDETIAEHPRYPCDDDMMTSNTASPFISPPSPFTSELIEFDNFIGLMEFLNHQDLLSYLAVPAEAKKGKTFHCIFHDGINAAAVVDNKNGKWKLFCNDENCLYHQVEGLDIIDITRKVKNLRWSDAVNFLGQYYNFTFKVATDFSRSQTLKLADNKAFLLNLEKHPNLSRLLSENMEVLLKLMDIAAINIYEDLINVCTDESIFFMSCRHLSEKVSFNYLDVNRILNLYANLGLIEKIPFRLVPKKYADKSERLATEGQTEGKSMPRIQYYTVHHFKVVATEAERRAAILCSTNFTLRDVTKTYFDSSLGLDITQYTYPDYRYHIEKKLSDQKRLVQIAILNNIKLYGFCGYDELRKDKGLVSVSTNLLKDSMKNLKPVLEQQNIIWMKMDKILCAKFGYDKFNYVFCDIEHVAGDISSFNMKDESDLLMSEKEHINDFVEYYDPVPF